MELRIDLGAAAPLSFVEPRTAPAAAVNSRPWLTSVGDLVLVARTGTYKGAFSNQNASVTILLDNRGNDASNLIGCPVGARAELYDDAALYFSGVIQSIAYGPQITIEIDA